MARGSALIIATLLFMVQWPMVTADSFPLPSPDRHGIGWFEGTLEWQGFEIDVRVAYPAETDGEGAVASNGTFPTLMWVPMDGETHMDYQWLDPLASDGVNVVVIDAPEDPGDPDAVRGMVNRTHKALRNANSSGVSGMPVSLIGGFHLEAWVIGGHGSGADAALLAATAHPAPMGESLDHRPWGVIGLGAGGTSLPDGLFIGQLGGVASGLFLTGSLDGIAPYADALTPMLDIWPGGWHAMEVLGANHLQYRDDQPVTYLFSDDEAPTIPESDQQAHALAHIGPWLDVVLREDLEARTVAFNRESGPTPADDGAYVSERTAGSRYLDVELDTLQRLNVSHEDSVSIIARPHLRSGAPLSNFSNATGNVTVLCLKADIALMPGQWDPSTNLARCVLPPGALAPGRHEDVRMSIALGPLVGEASMIVERTDAPLMPFVPIPDLNMTQGGQIVVALASLMWDPDGFPVQLQTLEWNASGENRFIAFSDANRLTIRHNSDLQWSGDATLSLTLNASGSNLTSSLNLTITVLDRDDPVLLLDAVPLQLIDEDRSTPLAIDLRPFVSDPEGADLVIDVVENPDGMEIETTSVGVRLRPPVDWSGLSIVNLSIGDGTTTPIAVQLPLQVRPIDDPMMVNSTRWTVTLEEEEVLTLPIAAFGFDVDDLISASVAMPSEDLVRVEVTGTMLRFQGRINAFGSIGSGFLTLSNGSGNHTAPLLIEVTPVQDPTRLSDAMTQDRGQELAVTVTVIDPDVLGDGTSRIDIEYRWVAFTATWSMPSAVECEVTGDVRVCEFITSAAPGVETEPLLQIRAREGGQNWTEPLNVETGPRDVITDEVATNTTRTATITGVVLLVIAGMVAFLSAQRRR